MEKYLPNVLCKIVNEYAEDFFDNVDWMLARDVYFNEILYKWEVEKMDTFINYHAYIIRSRSPMEQQYMARMLVQRIRKNKLTQYKTISNTDRSLITRGYILAMSKYLINANISVTRGLMPKICKFYRDSETFNVHFAHRKIKIPIDFFKELCYHLSQLT